MQVSQSGANIGSNNDLILIFGVLAVAGVVLYKTGIFGTAKAVTDVADTVVKAAGTVVTDVADLPANIVQGTADAEILAQAGATALTSNTTSTVEKVAVALSSLGVGGLVTGGLVATYYSIKNPITTQSIFNNAIQGKATGGITQRTANMIESIYKRYVGVNYANWSAMAVANGATFDSVGNISSDKTLSLGESQVYPIAKD